MSTAPAIEIEHASKIYGTGAGALTALAEVTLAVAHGEFLALMGPSGSGKSTLLNLVAGLDQPTSGSVAILGERLTGLSDDARSDLRLRKIGIVFQVYNLFPAFTVAQNVALPLEFLGVRSRLALARAATILAEVGIDTAAHRRLPAELSGGEQQRVALARALVTAPEILLADEPTGNLDSHTGETVLSLVRQLNAARELTVVMATHSTQAASYAGRTVTLLDGRIVSDEA